MTLTLNYGNLSGITKQANNLANELNDYCNNLSSKVQKNMYKVDGGMSLALNSADYYINAKIKQLRERESNARNLAEKVAILHETANRVDEDVARTIGDNQKAFFKNNPHLKASRQGFFGTLFGWGENAIKWLFKAGEWVADALSTLCKNIAEWFKSGGWKVVLTIVVAAVVAVLCIMSGGLLAVLGVGILAGLLGQIIKDVISVSTGGEWSKFENYIGASVAGGVGGLITYYTGSSKLGGAVSGALDVYVTEGLKVLFNEPDKKSWNEIHQEAAISVAVGVIVGGAFDKLKNTDLGKKLLGPIFTDRNSLKAVTTTQMKRLLSGNTSHISAKTVSKALFVKGLDTAIQYYPKIFAKDFIKNLPNTNYGVSISDRYKPSFAY